jgi:hypothetical protein
MFPMTIKLFLTLLGLSLCLSSCSKQPPLHVGAKYEYSMQISGPKLPYTLTGKREDVVVGEETVNGTKYFKSVTTYSGPIAELPAPANWFSAPETTLIRQGTEGIYRIDDYPQNNTEYLAIPLPLTVGKTWTVPVNGIEPVTMKIESIETVTVPSGEYKGCAKSLSRTEFPNKNEVVETYGYYAPDLGCSIKEEVVVVNRDDDSRLFIKTALERYTP